MVLAIGERANWFCALALATASGLALAAAFPGLDWNWLAWVALIPLIFAVDNQPLGRVWFYAWIYGLVFFAVSLFALVGAFAWIAYEPLWVSAAVILLLAALEALYGAIAFTCAAVLGQCLGLAWALTLPMTWTAFEWLRNFAPLYFPWHLLGYSAYHDQRMIQLASLTGVYGVSALVMLVNALGFALLAPSTPRKFRRLSLAVLVASITGTLAFGQLRLAKLHDRGVAGRVRLAMLQGGIAQSIKWNLGYRLSNFQIYVNQTYQAAAGRPDLIIWPESAAAFDFQPDDSYPFALWGDMRLRNRVLDLARRLDTPILLGAPAVDVKDGRFRSFDRAYLISRTGRVRDYYNKIQLVPFIEYVPALTLLGPIFRRLVKGVSELSAGRRQTLFKVAGTKIGVLICYEGIFPALARRAVAHGADILVNLTNEAWFKPSVSAQLLAMASLRAVETGAPMVRVANTGISAIIEPDGTIHARMPMNRREMEIEAVSWTGVKTIYDRVGDLFAEACAGLTVVALLAALLFPPLRRRRSQRRFTG